MALINPEKLYPLLFSPVYVNRIWGGRALTDFLGRDLDGHSGNVGEAWDVVDRAEAQSRVRNGALAGYTLNELMRDYKGQLMGSKWRGGNRFPLIIKMIDTGRRVSLQVHPDSAFCERHPEMSNCEPKTEMWYVISHTPGARIMAGLSQRSTRQQLLSLLGSNDVEQCLQIYPSKNGDAYFIPAGTIHSIDAGNLLLEVQQNSDCTLRLCDWGRTDENGKSRALHVQEAFEAIDFINRATPRIPGVVDEVEHNRKFALVNRSAAFSADVLKLRNMWRDDTHVAGSFHLLTAINNPIKVGMYSESEAMTEVGRGETVLIPACFGSYFVVPQRGGSTDVVRVTL